MKKIKTLGLVLMSAALLFTGCHPNNGGDPTSDPIVNPTPDPDPDPDPEPDPNPDPVDFEAPDLSSYYKYYLISSPKQATNKGIADWGAGSEASQSDDGVWTINSSASMWGGVGGICAPFTGFDKGVLANYEYIVFTLDVSSFTIDTTEDGAGNCGVNIKIPDSIVDITNDYTKNSGTRTYYAKMADFGTAPENAVEMAVIIGGSGSLKVSELYLAAAEDPLNKSVTSIAISPAEAKIEQNATYQFTVKDSNHKNITDAVTYSLSGVAAEGSSISATGLLTTGTTAGALEVTATYTVGEKEFTSSANITVMPPMVNLVKAVALEKYTSRDFNAEAALLEPDGTTVAIEGSTVTLHKADDSEWGEWSCQLFLKVTADGETFFETGKKYFVSVTVNSSAALEGCVWKEDMTGAIDQHGIAYEAGVNKTLTAEITGANQAYFKCLLSFPGAASDITVSNIKVYDVTE